MIGNHKYILSTLFVMVMSTSSYSYTQTVRDIVYSDIGDSKTYTVSSPDQTLEAVVDPYGGRAIEFYINGAWNRTKEGLSFFDRSNQVHVFDFALGTYTDLVTSTSRPRYAIEVLSASKLKMTAQAKIRDKSLVIQRTLEFLSNGQAIQKVSISNTSGQEILLDFDGLAFSTVSLTDIAQASQNNNNIVEYQYMEDDKIRKANINQGGWFGSPRPMDIVRNPQWITIADNFFLTVIKPSISNTAAVYHGLELGQKSRISLGIQYLATNLLPNQEISMELSYYIGPRSEELAVRADKNLKKMFAWPWLFHWMLKPIELGTYWLMSFLNNLLGSEGLTLILIAVIVKLILLPLSIKSAISMKKMRVLQPKLNKLQEKFGHEPQLLQQKTMELYKQEKVNPFGGCMPLLLQIPVFFALFRVLSRSVDLRGADFLWIDNLTMPDSLFMVGSFSFNLLPVIMTILQLVSVYLQQGRVGTTKNEMQKQMQIQGYLMPVIFLFLFWNMPSGLVLYWTTQNVFSILEQEVINIDSRFANKKIS